MKKSDALDMKVPQTPRKGIDDSDNSINWRPWDSSRRWSTEKNGRIEATCNVEGHVHIRHSFRALGKMERYSFRVSAAHREGDTKVSISIQGLVSSFPMRRVNFCVLLGQVTFLPMPERYFE